MPPRGKYVKDETWKTIGHKIKKREETGKRTAIAIDGRLIPSKKLHREVQRHRPTFMEQILSQQGMSATIGLCLGCLNADRC
jgi:hypothetical protein